MLQPNCNYKVVGRQEARTAIESNFYAEARIGKRIKYGSNFSKALDGFRSSGEAEEEAT